MAPTDQTGYLGRWYQVVNRGIELNGAGPLHKDGIWT
jgi:hypothetical protein